MHTLPTILLIDDSPEFSNLLREALELEGYQVLEVSVGREGLHLFRETRPDLVLLDMIMPEKDGIETLREFLELDPAARIITISGKPGAVTDHEPPLVMTKSVPLNMRRWTAYVSFPVK